MTIEDCPHGGDPYACLPCTGQRAARPAPQRERSSEHGARTIARFRGTCPKCGEMITTGASISLRDVGWTHTTC